MRTRRDMGAYYVTIDRDRGCGFGYFSDVSGTKNARDRRGAWMMMVVVHGLSESGGRHFTTHVTCVRTRVDDNERVRVFTYSDVYTDSRISTRGDCARSVGKAPVEISQPNRARISW